MLWDSFYHMGHFAYIGAGLSPQDCLAGAETLQGHRGRGVGRFLVCALANRLAGQGNTVELLCTPERAGFYRALGFEREGEVGSFGP